MNVGLRFLIVVVVLAIVGLTIKEAHEELRFDSRAVQGEPDDPLDLPNLAKQDDISRAVRVSAWADLLQLVVGALAIGLVFYTFKETRRSAQAAIDSAETAVQTARAHLHVEVAPNALMLQNYGQTPAVRIAIDIYWAGCRVESPAAFFKVVGR